MDNAPTLTGISISFLNRCCPKMSLASGYELTRESHAQAQRSFTSEQ